jgi:hypothetical protein
MMSDVQLTECCGKRVGVTAWGGDEVPVAPAAGTGGDEATPPSLL